MGDRLKPESPPLSERIAGGIGAALLLLLLGLIVRQALAGDHSPPDIAVEKTAVTRTTGGFRVEFTAVNRGGRAASAVVIEGRLPAGDGEPEVSQVTIDDIPRHSSRSGGLFFTSDPRSAPLQLRALGFSKP